MHKKFEYTKNRQALSDLSAVFREKFFFLAPYSCGREYNKRNGFSAWADGLSRERGRAEKGKSMIYSPLTRKAMWIAVRAHEGQKDHGGYPYIQHPFHVAESMETEASCAAALLHDVVEDTDVTFEDLEREGIPEEVLEALHLLTHEKSVPYLDYIRRLRKNPTARAVKRSDLRHNSDLTRLDDPKEEDLARVEKYRKALTILGED